MKWRIYAVGKPRLPFAAQAVAEYLGRLQKLANAEIVFLRANAIQPASTQWLRQTEGARRIILDESGKLLTSVGLANLIRTWDLSGLSRAAILVGGADGIPPETRDKADMLWSLSSLTLQHELALVIALEQLYRAHSIIAGFPYHRECPPTPRNFSK